MAVYVNTNVSSLNGQRYLNNVQNSLNTTYTPEQPEHHLHPPVLGLPHQLR